MTQDDTQGSYGQRGFNQLVFLNQTQVSAPLGSSCFLHGDSCLLPLPPVGPHRLLVVYHLEEKDTPHELIQSSLIQARIKLPPPLLL